MRECGFLSGSDMIKNVDGSEESGDEKCGVIFIDRWQ